MPRDMDLAELLVPTCTSRWVLMWERTVYRSPTTLGLKKDRRWSRPKGPREDEAGDLEEKKTRKVTPPAAVQAARSQ